MIEQWSLPVIIVGTIVIVTYLNIRIIRLTGQVMEWRRIAASWEANSADWERAAESFEKSANTFKEAYEATRKADAR